MPVTKIYSKCAQLRTQFLDGLTPSEIEIILAAGTQQQFRANTVITTQGDPANRMFLLTKGRARYFFMTQDGHKNLLSWFTPGHIFGGAALLMKPSPYFVSAEAVRDISAVVWDSSTIRELAARYPKLMENMFMIMADYLNWYVATHVALTCQTARQRPCSSRAGYTVIPHSSSMTGRPPRVAARPVPPAKILRRAVRPDPAQPAARAAPRTGCADFAPRGRFLRHGNSLSSCVVAGEKADDGGSSWLPR